MRIAEIAPVWFPVPPSGYGGIEVVVALLADGLVERGHDVTVFASGGSRTKARLVSPLDAPPDPALLGNVWFDTYHALTSYLHAAEFDVVHDHSGIIGPALGAMLERKPCVVHTLHGPWTDPVRRYYALLDERVDLVSISLAQQHDNPGIRYAGSVYNGIDPDAYEFRAGKGDRLVYIGRATPDKGPVRAIRAARQAGRPLDMILKANEPPERDYLEREIAPLLDDDVTLRSDVSHEEKVEMLASAAAMVFPIQWMEPFGLVMVEAMACGTPVVTTKWGAAPELVEDGVTGFLRDTDDELAAALDRIGEIDPEACRERVDRLFSAAAMVAGYEEVFARVIG